MEYDKITNISILNDEKLTKITNSTTKNDN